MQRLARYGSTPLAWRLGFLYAVLFVVVGFSLPTKALGSCQVAATT
jgi:hypothetical protein